MDVAGGFVGCLGRVHSQEPDFTCSHSLGLSLLQSRWFLEQGLLFSECECIRERPHFQE